MAVMSARITGGGGSLIDSGVADVFAKALFGDPEREMALAKGRSDLATDEYTRRLLEEKAAYEQARTSFQTGQNAAIEGAVDPAAQLVMDNINRAPPIEPPVPVVEDANTPIPLPTSRPELAGTDAGLPVPVEAEVPPALPLPDYAFNPDVGSMRFDPQPDITAAAQAEPVPVTDYLGDPAGPETATGEPLPPDAAAPPPQQMPGGGGPIEIERDNGDGTVSVKMTIDQARALVKPGLYTNDPAGQIGKTAGSTGTVYGGTDRESKERNALLYAGKTAAESAGAAGKAEMDLRKEYFNQEPVKRFDITQSRYKELINGLNQRDGVGDTVAIYAMIKMLDPPSSVMEGEQVTAANAPGLLPAQIVFFNNLLSMQGDKFDDTGRDAFLQAGKKLYDSRAEDVKAINDYYARVAAENGIRPENVIFPLGDESTAPPMTLPPGFAEAGYTEQYIQDQMTKTRMTREQVIKSIKERLSAGGG